MAKMGMRKESGRFDILWLADGFAQGRENPLIQAVDPRMDRQFLATLPCVFNDGGAGYVAGLGKDIEFTQAVEALAVIEGVEF